MRFALVLFCVLGVMSLRAQTSSSGSGPWRVVDERAIMTAAATNSPADLAERRNVVPQIYRTLELNRPALEKALASAPREFSAALRDANVEILLPLADGTFGRFRVQESPMMEPELAAKFPELKTYLAQGIDDPTATARMDLTPRGFHAVILSAGGQTFIDPYWRDSDTTYVAYKKSDYIAEKPFNCLVESQPARAARDPDEPTPARPTGATLRIYRLAVACTGEYSVAVASPQAASVANSLGAIITSVNRVNAIYERDLAVRMVLVGNNDRIIYLNGSTDPYSNMDGGAMLGQNQSTVDSQIGGAAYDIGHVFSTGGGGVAYLGAPCDDFIKAGGVTGLPNPTGDPFDVDYVAHEMGHQFGGNHTFNATAGSCGGGNRNGSTAYEAGSGTTIMAYAGICGAADLAANSDDYFHTGSYTEMDDFVSNPASGGSCDVAVNTGNNPPMIAALTARTIPANTPFALTASATDANGDALTYAWEEFDLGAAQTGANPSASSSNPLFRSFLPTLNSRRTFPSLTYILNNANVPPATVGDFATGEVLPLPATSRTMNFRVTVRDNRAGGGGSDWAATTVTAVNTGTAFAVTSQNSAATIAAGSAQTVTWNVAGSNANGINCANVKISLSTDGGFTFPIVLATSVPNNGSANVVIPNATNVATTQGRIKVEAAGNIFFDISNANLTITSTNAPPSFNVTSSLTLVRGTPTAVNATVGSASSAETPLSVSVANVPEGITITPAISGSSVILTGTAVCRVVTTRISRTYPVVVTVTDNAGATTSRSVDVVVQPNPRPTLGDYPASQVVRAATINVAPASGPADANGNLLPAPLTVSPTSVPGGGTVSINQATGAVTVATTSNSTLSTFRVRVTLSDTCGGSTVKEFNVRVVTRFANYLAGFGLTGANADPLFDFDSDGTRNLLEYALGLDPTLPDTEGLPVVTLKDYSGTKFLSMTFTRSSAATDLSYIVEGSNDLNTWTNLAMSTGGAPMSGPGFVGETGSAPAFAVEVRDTVAFDPASATPRFLRLRVTSP